MDEPVMAELVISQGKIAAPTNGKGGNNAPALSLQDQVHNAAEFGWLVAELLGRCFLLLEAQPPHLDWSGKTLVMLEGLLTPREKILSVVAHMCYLAETLDIGQICTIDHDPADYKGRAFADVVKDTVEQLCEGSFDAGKNETFETVRGRINECFFFWDLKINDALQGKPAVVEKAYLIGYCLGALRWWYGLPGFQLDNTFKAKVLQYLPVLSPHLPQFAPSGLAGSIGPWWDAIEAVAATPTSASPSNSQQTPVLTPADLQKQIDALQKQIAALQATSPAPADLQQQIDALQKQIAPLQKQADTLQADGLAPADLQKQAHIWYSLIAGECDALSYVNPTIRNQPYIWQIFQVTWPLFVGGVILLLLVLAFVIYLIVTYHNQIVAAVATAGGLLAIFGIIQNVQKSTGDVLQKAVSDATATIKGSYLDRVWNATLQKEVNKAVFVPPPAPPVQKNAPQSPVKK